MIPMLKNWLTEGNQQRFIERYKEGGDQLPEETAPPSYPKMLRRTIEPESKRSNGGNDYADVAVNGGDYDTMGDSMDYVHGSGGEEDEHDEDKYGYDDKDESSGDEGSTSVTFNDAGSLLKLQIFWGYSLDC